MSRINPPQSRKDRQEQIKEMLKIAPELSNRAIARTLSVSHHTVGAVRQKLEASGQIAHVDRDENSWIKHPYILKNPQLLENLNPRTLRALKAPGVLDLMQKKGTLSARYAQQLLRKERDANKTAPVNLTGAVDIRCDDLKNGLLWIPSESVDLVLCDPPYGKEHLELYECIGTLAERVLCRGGSLVVMCGQAHLPEVIAELGTHLRYNWCLSNMADRGANVLKWRGVMPRHKVVLWYVKGKYTGTFVSDVIKAPPPDKTEGTLHKWEQSVGGFEKLVQLFSDYGDTVLDPCIGSGTTGVA